MAYQYTPNVYGVYDPEKSFEENKQNGAVLTKENLDKLENQVKKNSADITVEVSNGEISESNVTFDEEQGVKKIVVKVPESVDAYTKTEVDEKISALVNGAPETADTLKELSDLISSNSDAMDLLNSAIGSKANSSDVYTKEEVDGKIPNVENKADKATTLAGYGIEDAYTKSEVDGMIPDISGKANSDDVYTKTQVDEKIPDISGKADTATTLAGYGIQDAYTKSEVDGKIPDISGKANSDDVYTKTQVDEKVESFVTLPSSWYTVSAGVIPESFSPRESDIFDVDPANGVFQKIVLHKNGSIGKVTTEEGEQKIVEKLPELSAEHPLIVLQVESGDDTEGVIFTSYSFYFDLIRHINTREDGVPIIAIIYWDGTATQLAVPFGAQFVLEQSVNSGTTAKRPVLARAGQTYFDTDLGKPIFYTGTKWVDATGADV